MTDEILTPKLTAHDREALALLPANDQDAEHLDCHDYPFITYSGLEYLGYAQTMFGLWKRTEKGDLELAPAPVQDSLL